MNKQFQINFLTGCKTVNLKSDDDIIKLALMLSANIINDYEEKIIDTIIKNDCSVFDPDERSLIKDKSIKKISHHKKELQSVIFCALCKYIKDEDVINIEGYVIFRLENYKKYLGNYVEDAVNEYINEAELDEIADTLAFFAQMQPSVTEFVILLYDEDKYIIADESGEVFLSLANYDNILLDILLSISPERIAIINADKFDNQYLVEMIIKVFGSKIIFAKYGQKD